jgi:hypothetical protein
MNKRSEAPSAGEHEPAAKRERKPSAKALQAPPVAAKGGAGAKQVRASAAEESRTRERHVTTKTAARGVAAPVPCIVKCARLRAREPGTPERLAVSLSARAPPLE